MAVVQVCLARSPLPTARPAPGCCAIAVSMEPSLALQSSSIKTHTHTHRQTDRLAISICSSTPACWLMCTRPLHDARARLPAARLSGQVRRRLCQTRRHKDAHTHTHSDGREKPTQQVLSEGRTVAPTCFPTWCCLATLSVCCCCCPDWPSKWKLPEVALQLTLLLLLLFSAEIVQQPSSPMLCA